MNLDAIKRLNELDIKVRWLILASGLVVILAIDAMTFLNFQWAMVQKSGQEEQAIADKIQGTQNDLGRKTQIQSGLQGIEEKIGGFQKKILPLENMSKVLEDISRLANDTQVKINKITPQPELQQILTVNPNLKYYALPIVIQATSGYHMFGSFMTQLESAQMALDMESFSIEYRGPGMDQLEINARIRVILSESTVVQ